MKNKLAILFGLILLSYGSCKKSDPTIPNEEEVITTLIYTLIPYGGGDTVVFKFYDEDGDGGIDPIYQSDTLKKNTTYIGVLQLLNEQEEPAKDITLEVQEEATEHQLFYLSKANGTSIIYMDIDTNGHPIGIKTQLSTGDASSGKLTIVLRHEPAKTAAGVSGGDITNAGGETDIEVNFQLFVR